jgi:hypothetical protein
MNIAGFEFRLITKPTLSSSPGIYIYIHQASGRCFVSPMRNSRMQRSSNNYPTNLKALLKTHSSEVLLYLAELPDDSKETGHNAKRVVSQHLTEKGVLFKKPRKKRCDFHGELPDLPKMLFTVWVLTHKDTGALFYFEAIKGEDVTRAITHRMLTFNNYVLKSIANENRVMYSFAKDHFPLDIEKWVIRDLDLALLTEEDACRHITRCSKQHIDLGEVVLNRISNNDALYYRNVILRKPTVSMAEYLKSK